MVREEKTNSGNMGCVPVQPRLNMRQLSRIDTHGVIANKGIVARSPFWYRKAAEKAALRQLNQWYSTIEKSRDDTTNKDSEKALPVPSRFRWHKSIAGYAPSVPWHSASIDQAGILNPFVVSGYPPFNGPIIGRSALTGNIWTYDAWSPYQTHTVTSCNGWIIGLMGSGKSMLLKTFAARETASPWNRHVIIEGDPKGEWASVAQAVGGQVIAIGSGRYLNTLDPGEKPASMSEADWRRQVLSIQNQSLHAMAAVLRSDTATSIDAQERAVIGKLLNEYVDRNVTPTLTDMVNRLSSTWANTTHIDGLDSSATRSAANRLILLYNPLITGELSGAFERESTISIDPTSPMIVFNTGSADDNTQKKALYMAAMSATVERLCAQRDGRFRIVIAEEGHELLSNPVLVRAWDRRMRLCGDLGVSNWFLMHELGDLSSFGEANSEHRNMMNSILTKSTSQIIYSQSAASLEQMERLISDLTVSEINTIKQLPEYCALWRVGNVRDIIRPLISPQAYDVFQTDKNRQG
jgi:hypothetical protein